MVAIWSFCSGEGVKLENSLSDHLSNISHIATEISSKIIVSHCSCFILVVLVWLAVKLKPSHTPPHRKQITSTFVNILVWSGVKWTATCWQWLCLILSEYGCENSLSDHLSNKSHITTEISNEIDSFTLLLFHSCCSCVIGGDIESILHTSSPKTDYLYICGYSCLISSEMNCNLLTIIESHPVWRWLWNWLSLV